MHRKHSALRAAAALAATMFVAVGSTGPAYAGNGNDAKPAQAGHASSASSHRGASQNGAPRGRQGTNAPRHQAVTVCHLLGNGSYHLLTFDDHALRAHQAHGDLYPVPAGGCPATPSTAPTESTAHQHDRVTVCHLLGNGSYHLLTFDQHALKAHVGHGDLYPVPATGCPTKATGTGEAVPGETQTLPAAGADSTSADDVQGVHEVAVELGKNARQAPHADVLGVQAVRAANRAPAQVAPAGGILPQTGAPAIATAVLAGLGLLAAGGVLLARKRPHTGR